MNFLVTGGAGFIGSHVCERLLEDGHKVVCLDNFDEFYSKAIKQNNLKHIKEHPRFSLIVGDIRDTDELIDVLEHKKINVVIHLAAKAGVSPSMKNPTEYVAVNTQGTVSVYEAMKEAGVKYMVMASSSSVYGDKSMVPFSENQILAAPISAYAATKQACEIFAQMYAEVYQISTCALRFFTVYGPRQRPDLAIHKFVKSILTGQAITINGDGSMQRDYTYIDDIVQGILSSTKHVCAQSAGYYEVFNIGNSSPVTLMHLIQTIEKVTQKQAVLKYRDVPLGDVPRTFADIEKAQQHLGYQPQTSLEEGIKQFQEWLLQVME
jgi:UDP-glucuronate 4-epimerase